MEHRLDVQTADAVTFNLEPAGLGSRTAAVAVDLLIQNAAILLVYVTIFIILGSSGDGLSGYMLAFVVILLFLIFFGYHPIFEAIWSGQTPGKRLFKLRVVKSSGQPIGFLEALLRNIGRVIDYAFLIGFFVAFISKKEQRIGDMIAGTIVIRERSYELPTVGERIVSYYLPSNEVAIVRANRDKITQQEFTAIRNFLSYRDQLPKHRREEIAVHLAGLATKVGLKPRLPAEAEPFLEDLYSICME